ncbi:2-dehydropantoate 2-reductase [Ureibacillus sp. MALMAid1270]|uniref:2-dehydropantoate 2-reductase n=1 Tax=Ureibacillus sp. MALMAid1270 TaxID=3411629 RepID=UPI003BA4CCA9
MEVIVIGAGAVGMLVASFLSKIHNVTLVTRRPEQAEAFNREGLKRINLDGTIEHSMVRGLTALPSIQEDTMIIVAVKYGQLKTIYPQLSLLPENTPLLFLQNGLAHFDEVLSLSHKNIAFGSCQFGAQKQDDYTVIHRGFGALKIAIERGNKELYTVLKAEDKSDFQLEFAPNAEQMLFEKALLNCFVNPLTALLKVKNGYLIQHQTTLHLLEQLFVELKSVFSEEMEKFNFEDVISLCEKTASNTSSMLSDVLNDRQTEIDTIALAMIKKAHKRGKNLPTLSTLYYLIKATEEKRVEKM